MESADKKRLSRLELGISPACIPVPQLLPLRQPVFRSRRTAQSRPFLCHLLAATRRLRVRDSRYYSQPYLYLRLRQPLPKRSRRLYRSHRTKGTQTERHLPSYSAHLPIRTTLPLIVPTYPRGGAPRRPSHASTPPGSPLPSPAG